MSSHRVAIDATHGEPLLCEARWQRGGEDDDLRRAGKTVAGRRPAE